MAQKLERPKTTDGSCLSLAARLIQSDQISPVWHLVRAVV